MQFRFPGFGFFSTCISVAQGANKPPPPSRQSSGPFDTDETFTLPDHQGCSDGNATSFSLPVWQFSEKVPL